MASLGDLTVRLGLDNTDLNRGASDSESRLTRLRGRMASVAKGAAALGVAAGAAGAAITAGLVRSGLSAIDSQEKLARSLRGTYDEVRALQIVASDSGVDGLEGSLARLNQTLGRAENGMGRALPTLERLNLSAAELSQMPLDRRMASIADAIQNSGMSAQEAAGHLQQLGFTQSEAVEMFMQGGQAIRDARQEVDDFGLSVSSVDAAQIESANDAMSRIGRVIEVIRNRLTVALAPILEHIADLFNDAAREAGGFREQVDRSVESGVRGFTRVADVIEGVRRTGLVAGQAIATAFLKISETVLRVAVGIMDGPVEALNHLINTANRLPKIKIPEVESFGIADSLREDLEIARGAVAEGRQAMHETLMEPMPSSGIEQRLAEIRENARKTAEETVAAREKMEFTGGGEDGDDPAAEAHREQLEARLDRIREANMEEAELAQSRYERDRELLEQAKENELLTEEEFAQESEKLAERHQGNLNRILEGAERDRNKTIGMFAKANQDIRKNSMASETAQLRSGLQTMFGDHKQFGKALGNLKRIEAVMSAYAWGSSIGGPPMGAAAAATAAYAQLSSKSQIDSASFSGGSTQPNAGSTTAPMQEPMQQQQQQGGTLRVEGITADSLITGDMFMKAMNAAKDDGMIRDVVFA